MHDKEYERARYARIKADPVKWAAYVERRKKYANRQLPHRREYYRRTYIYQIWDRARYRAKQQNLAFDITIDDIVIPDICPVLGIPIVVGKGAPTPNSPSLDKMHPHEGYVKGNVQVISNRANSLKRDGTPDELRKVADWVEANQF